MSLAVLLDTHALLWWTHQPTSLSRRARAAIGSNANRVFVSPVSAFEISTKSRKGKLEFVSPLVDGFADHAALDGFEELPVSAAHAQLAGSLVSPHNDPWDRLLAAQARIEGLALVTSDAKMAGLGVSTYW